MRLLDLFCGAGGASVGYRRAGFSEIVGVDIRSQPNYPFHFVREDALKFPLDGFDLIHASPPCQAYTWGTRRDRQERFPALIGPIRERLGNRLHVIENVPGSPLIKPVRLCGEMFGLNVIRHRIFEANWMLPQPPHKPHKKAFERQAKDGSGRRVKVSPYCCVAGHGGNSDTFALADWREAMGIDWMNKAELVESIPPAYTEYIGRAFMVWGRGAR